MILRARKNNFQIFQEEKKLFNNFLKTETKIKMFLKKKKFIFLK